MQNTMANRLTGGNTGGNNRFMPYLMVVLVIIGAITAAALAWNSSIQPAIASAFVTEDNWTPELLMQTGYTPYSYNNSTVLFAKNSYGGRIGADIVPIQITAGEEMYRLYLSCKGNGPGWSTYRLKMMKGPAVNRTKEGPCQAKTISDIIEEMVKELADITHQPQLAESDVVAAVVQFFAP